MQNSKIGGQKANWNMIDNPAVFEYSAGLFKIYLTTIIFLVRSVFPDFN